MAESAVVIPIRAIDENATSNIKGVIDELKKLNEQVAKGSKIAEEATRTSSSLGQSFLNLAKRVAGPVVLITAFYKTLKTGMTETIEVEKATRLLSAQYQALGVTNKAVTDDIIKFTTALAEQTANDQSALIDIARLISSFGIYGESLKEATKATLDISTAMGIDQETAARAVGKAIGGSADALKRYGINVKEALTPTENLANLMEALRQKGFSGAAAADIDTMAGALRNLLETFKNFSEALVNTKLFGLISLRDIFKSIVENISISVKAVGNFISTGSAQGNASLSIKDRNASKAILAENIKLTKEKNKQLALDKASLKETERKKKAQEEINDLFKDANSALEATKSEEEQINDLFDQKVARINELLDAKDIEIEKANELKRILQETHDFEINAIRKEKTAKEQAQVEQKSRDILSAAQGGDATNIAGSAAGAAAPAVAVLALYLKFPVIIQQIGEGIKDLFTDWADGWQDLSSMLFGGTSESFIGGANFLEGTIENFNERMKTLENSIEDAAMSAHTTAENIKIYNQRVSEGRKSIKAVLQEFEALREERTARGSDRRNATRAIAGLSDDVDVIVTRRRSRKAFKEMFDELEKAIEEQIPLITQQHNLRMQQLNEELSLWQNVNQGFENLKKTISGALLSPEQSSAAALKAFQEATGADKAEAALNVQNALLNEFQSAQQAAASGIITQEELKNKQASILAQLETAHAQTQAREDKILSLMERENKIFLSQLEELNNIRKVLEGVKSFQEGGQVNKTGFAFVHEGEKVIPKGAATGNVNIMINGKSMGTGTDIVAMLQEALKTNRGGIRDTLKRLI
jgi:hypothetical protein